VKLGWRLVAATNHQAWRVNDGLQFGTPEPDFMRRLNGIALGHNQPNPSTIVQPARR
jgi:hypothetical protein